MRVPGEETNRGGNEMTTTCRINPNLLTICDSCYKTICDSCHVDKDDKCLLCQDYASEADC